MANTLFPSLTLFIYYVNNTHERKRERERQLHVERSDHLSGSDLHKQACAGIPAESDLLPHCTFTTRAVQIKTQKCTHSAVLPRKTRA